MLFRSLEKRLAYQVASILLVVLRGLTRHSENTNERRPRQVVWILQDLKVVQVILDEVVLERFQGVYTH